MKKGELHIAFLIGIIIFAFLVVITIIFLVGPGKENWDRLKNLLPAFGKNETEKTEVLIIGYNLNQNAPKYYDGLEWQEFKTDLVYDGQKITSTQVKKYFEKYYLFRNDPLPVAETKLSIEVTTKIAELYMIEDGRACLPSALKLDNKPLIYTAGPPGAVAVTLKNGLDSRDEKVYGLIQITKEDQLRYFKNIFDSECQVVDRETVPKVLDPNSEKEKILYDTIGATLKKWRDSILIKPIELRYGEEKIPHYYCVEKFEIPDSVILSLDLSKEKYKDAQCN